VAPIASSGLVLSSEVGSVSGTVDALARAAALRVFSAEVIASHGPSAATALGIGEVMPGMDQIARVIGSSPNITASPVGSAILIDASLPFDALPAQMAGTLRPEMSVNGGHDVLVGGTGDDLLVGGEGRNVLVGGYSTQIASVPDANHIALDTLLSGGWGAANNSNADDAMTAGLGSADEYYVLLGRGGSGTDETK
jgi:hypothetical protein